MSSSERRRAVSSWSSAAMVLREQLIGGSTAVYRPTGKRARRVACDVPRHRASPVPPSTASALGPGAEAMFLTATAGAASESHIRRSIRPEPADIRHPGQTQRVG